LHANRLSQYLAVIFPTKNYCDLDRKKFLKVLDEIEQELKQTPHALSGLALMELKKMSTFGVHRLDWLVVSKRFPWNAKYETVKMSTFSLHRLGWLMVRT
jgi:hypothetical protein